MAKIVVGFALHERLGPGGARELNELIEQHSERVRADMVTACEMSVNTAKMELADRIGATKVELAERFVVTLADTRTQLIKEIAGVRVDLSETLAVMRGELLRWSFAFWIGQVAAMFAALAMFAQWIRP